MNSTFEGTNGLAIKVSLGFLEINGRLVAKSTEVINICLHINIIAIEVTEVQFCGVVKSVASNGTGGAVRPGVQVELKVQSSIGCTRGGIGGGRGNCGQINILNIKDDIKIRCVSCSNCEGIVRSREVGSC